MTDYIKGNGLHALPDDVTTPQADVMGPEERRLMMGRGHSSNSFTHYIAHVHRGPHNQWTPLF